jgi:threonine/homoserine/homoserine lactone efflux protein
MLPITTLLAFLATAAVLVAIPGPSVLFIVGRSVAEGRRAGLATVAGADLGLLVLALGVAFGLGAVIAASELTYLVLKITGALYLVYLGVQTIRHRKTAAAATAADRRSLARGLGQSFLVGATNPKTLAICAAVFPQFVHPTGGSPVPQLVELAVIFWALAMLSDSVWAVAAGTARHWFARSPRRSEHLAAGGGAMMIALGGISAVAKRS